MLNKGLKTNIYNNKMKGIVRQGKQEARKYGTPTANIYVEDSLELGIFKGYFIYNNITYKSCIYVSKEGAFTKIESYAIDKQDLDLYNKEIDVIVLDKVRDIKSFDTYEELKSQILKDVEDCRN